MKITFHYVRHGETLFNVLGRMQGWCDSPLTERGIRQAEMAHDSLLSVPLNRAFSSTSERCVDTANIILKDRNVPLTTAKSLKETFFGDWEGEKECLILDSLKIHRQTGDFSDAHGESRAQVRERILTTFDQILSTCKDGDSILIVSHGTFFLQMSVELFHIPREELLSRITVPSGYKGNPIANGYAADFIYDDGSYRFTWIKGIENINSLYK